MLTFHHTPTIVGKRIRLRPFVAADHDTLWAMMEHEAVPAA